MQIYLKKPPGRSEKYLDYIKESPCWVCGEMAEAHHTETAGTGLKGSDFSCIPLCRCHHAELHAIGKATFQAIYHINLDSAVKERLLFWADQNWSGHDDQI